MSCQHSLASLLDTRVRYESDVSDEVENFPQKVVLRVDNATYRMHLILQSSFELTELYVSSGNDPLPNWEWQRLTFTS